MSEFCRESAQARSWREHDSACDFKFEIFERGAPFEVIEHRSDFSGRAAGDVEKAEQFIRRPALEAFSDVVGDGEGSAVELVALRPSDAVFGGQDEVLATFGESYGVIPDREIFETLVGHVLGISDFKFEI
jgi:hypothetical protein